MIFVASPGMPYMVYIEHIDCCHRRGVGKYWILVCSLTNKLWVLF